MKQSLKAVVTAAALLLAGSARAEVLYQGKVYQTTADRIIKRDLLVCAYGDWTFQTLPNGSTAVIRGKYCQGSSK